MAKYEIRKVIKSPKIYEAKSLDKALHILDCFSFQKRELTLTEICRLTSLNKTTVKRLISNLTRRNYLSEDTAAKRYHLGIRMFELGGIVFSSFELRKATSRPMTQLQSTTGCTVLLGVLMDRELVYIDKREGSGMIRISSDIGWRRPLHYGMLGMVLMAYLPPDEVNEILEKYPLEAHTKNSITDRHAFFLRLEKIRNDGYVIESEEAVEGVLGIAAPIRDYSRQVVASMGVALPKTQANTESQIQNNADLVKKTCDEISSNLGYLKI